MLLADLEPEGGNNIADKKGRMSPHRLLQLPVPNFGDPRGDNFHDPRPLGFPQNKVSIWS